MPALRRTDVNGRPILNGSRVLSPEGVPSIVRIVEGPIPGSRATREGIGTFYVGYEDGSEHFVFRADELRVIPWT